MLGFKTFRCARILLGGIELMHMVAKGQMKDSGGCQTPADQFYSLIRYAILIISLFYRAAILIAAEPFDLTSAHIKDTASPSVWMAVLSVR
jgi:hypothetical protein